LPGFRSDCQLLRNAYGPKTKKTLDYELNAHQGASADGRIVGYMTKEDGSTPEIQRPNDPCPGYYISTSGFFDRNNPNRLDRCKFSLYLPIQCLEWKMCRSNIKKV
jgi:hypothetical protein